MRLIVIRQAHVIGAGRRKRKAVHITQNGRKLMHEHSEEIPERSLRTLNLKGQIPEYTLLHGRMECRLLQDATQGIAYSPQRDAWRRKISSCSKHDQPLQQA